MKHKTQSLTEGNILKSLLAFAIPVFAALLLQAMYGAVDMLIVGKFATVADQSGVATGSAFSYLIIAPVAGLVTGVTVWIAEAIGRGDRKDAGRGVGGALWIFSVLIVAFTLFVVLFAETLARLMHAPAEAFSQTTDYIRICGGGLLFILSYNVLGAIFRGTGDSKTPLFTVWIACIANIGLDLLFIAVFHLGAAGAAWATILAQGISVAVCLLVIRRRELPFELGKEQLRPDGSCIGRILAVGIPLAIQELLVQISFLFIQVVVNDMDVTASAAVGVAEKVCAFLMLVGSAFAQAMSAFVAQNNGAGQHERAKRGLFYGMGSAFAAGVAMGSLAFFGGHLLASIFSSDAAVIAAAHDYLKAYAIDCLLTAIFFCLVGYFNGCEKSLFVMIQGLVGAFCVRIPTVFFVSKLPNVTLFQIGLGTPASSVVQTLLCGIAFFLFEREYKRSQMRVS